MSKSPESTARFIVASMMLVFVGYLFTACNAPTFKPIRKQPEFHVKCLNCGSQWLSSKPGNLKHCMNCDFRICDETVETILAIATLQEIAKQQPDNIRAAQELAKDQAKLEEHCKHCDKCRDALSRQGLKD